MTGGLLFWLAAPAATAATLQVSDHGSVQAAIDAASPGDTVVVGPGRWEGAVRVDRAVTLRGGGGVIDGRGVGSVVVVSGAGAVLDGLHVTGSGASLTPPDSCVYIEGSAQDAALRNGEFTDCGFGVWVNEGVRVEVSDNHVTCRDAARVTEKGNGVHLFDGSHLLVRRNVVQGCRDGIYVSATEDSLIEGNVATDQRYGIHYMFSYRNTIRGNVTRHNHGGIALMQSRDLLVTDNISTDNSLQGILFRDTPDSVIARNEVARNGEGMFFFSCVRNLIADNDFVGNQIGARVWAGTEDNVIRGNRFIGNRQQVLYVAATDQVWGDDQAGNTWSDYLGWDQDGDGRGDRPYRADALAASLLYRFPSAVLLLHSPTMELLGWVQARLPVMRVPTVIEPHPQLEGRP